MKGEKLLKRQLLAVALGMAFAGAVGAQSNVTGSIFGNAEANSTIVVVNKDTGLTRRIPVGSNGRYQVSSLPNGSYTVSQEKNGAVTGTRENVAVVIASGTEVSFASAAPGNTLSAVTVTSSVTAIDVSQTDTRTVLTAEELNKLSVARDVSSAALLAPSVVFSDSYKQANGTTIPSFGGAASSENAYYINGFNVTNPLNSLGFTTLPFDSIAQQQVLTGGYGAEFGRSTGGVINIVTKRGGNTWKGGVYTSWTPRGTRAAYRDYYYATPANLYPNTPANATDGTLLQYRGANSSWESTVGGYVSGPLIKDRLFFYANLETTRDSGNFVNSVRLDGTGSVNQKGGWRDYENNTPRGLVKLDWHVSDNHLLEVTALADYAKREYQGYAFNYAGTSHGSTQFNGATSEDKARMWIGKYTGYLTDTMTLSASYGRQQITHTLDLFGYNPNCAAVSVGTSPNARAPGIPSANYDGSCQIYPAVLGFQPGPKRHDETKGGRIDFNWVIGNHDIRIGYERQDASSLTNQSFPGNFSWNYLRAANPTVALGSAAGIGSPASGGGLGTQGYYVTRAIRTFNADLGTVQASQFIEDRWQITDNFLLSLGLRNEQFKNYDAIGREYIKQDKQLAPRIGAAWDVFGDSTFKVFANAGRYHLASPSSAAQRGAARNTTEYYTYTGVAADGTPTGLAPIALDPSKGQVCPGTNWVSANQECGKGWTTALQQSAIDIKAHYQDEFILGFESAATETLNFGAKLTYRTLKNAIDDVCDPRVNYGRCVNFNPGVDNTFYSEDRAGNFTYVTLTAAQLGMPKLKRTYQALDFFVEHGFSNGWYGKAEYTFSSNKGNTEGQLSSELDTGGGGQIDVARTQDWDKPGLMDNAYGYLPNHRAHQLKVFGYFQLTESVRVGGSWMWASGRPQSCLSFHPDPTAVTYASSTNFFCGLNAYGNTTAVSRGTFRNTPHSSQLNLNVAYVPVWAGKKLTLQADVFNVLNRQSPAMYYPRYASSQSTVNALFGRELYYSSPRYLRLTARYDF